MLVLRHIFTAIIFILFFAHCQAQNIKGLSFVAPSSPFEKNPMEEIKAVSAEWIALIPYAFSYINKPKVHHSSNQQWWGERPEGIIESIRLAKEKGIKVMLKPQVWIPRGWVGEMDFLEESDWIVWENSYRKFLLEFVEIAINYDVEMLCIGTEFKIAIQKRESFWRTLIEDVREIYDGKIIYCSNWDSYENVPFWDDVDFIGISAYFPLTPSKTPTKKELIKKWNPIVNKLSAFSEKHQKKIIFTEFGYMGIDQCAWKNWELEKVRRNMPLNEVAQQNAIDALFEVFWEKDFWAGGFLWKWFPNIDQQKAATHKDYTPQGKLALRTVQHWYDKKD